MYTSLSWAAKEGRNRRQSAPDKDIPEMYEKTVPQMVERPTTTKGSIPMINFVGSKIGRDRTALSAVKKPSANGIPEVR